jgi:hypothetical protein
LDSKNVKPFCLFLVAIVISAFLGCESLNVSPAPMTMGVIQAGAAQRVDEPTLREGRRLFVSRCIQCHTLPVVWYYNKSEWPGIVRSMAERSSLKPAEEKALVAYIRAVRAQP